MATVPITWTPEQKAVIAAAPEARILVDAGPGTGKTATACARIAHLMASDGLEATQIWLISFTRTAVRELRDRIAGYCGSTTAVAGMKIATIDMHAWAINSGFDETATLTGTFDDNIANVIRLVKEHAGVFQYLSSVRHLVVDEAQDVVGLRCELLLELIHALPRTCGVSVFSDDAQAIYGFAEEESGGQVEGHLAERIREYMPDFQPFHLNAIHRTSDATLKSVFADGRKLLREDRRRGATRLKKIKTLIASANHGDVGLYREDIAALPDRPDDTFLLFRRRGEVLDACGYLGTRPHRIRMSGLPICIQGGVAVMFWDWTEPVMDESEFLSRYTKRCSGGTTATGRLLWATLLKLFGTSPTRVSVTKLVTRLASPSPPYELTKPEFGSRSGPLLGTIHGAKGREASEVRLYLPPDPSNDVEDESLGEEARVLFVGATRARQVLKVGKAATKALARRLESSGRAFTVSYSNGSKRARVEVGAAKDIDAVGLVGRNMYPTANDAAAAQNRIVALAEMTELRADQTNEDMEWRYRVTVRADDNGGTTCYLAPTLNNDLFNIARVVGYRKPPEYFVHLRYYGYRTIAVAPDDPVREHLHSPWRDSGMIVAPMIMGYPVCYFRY